jgi:hypothetical protein
VRPIFRKHPKLSSAGASANRRRRAFCPQSFPDVASLIRATAQVDFSTSHVWSPSLRARAKRSTNQHGEWIAWSLRLLATTARTTGS